MWFLFPLSADMLHYCLVMWCIALALEKVGGNYLITSRQNDQSLEEKVKLSAIYNLELCLMLSKLTPVFLS